jgi:hypothetical protein
MIIPNLIYKLACAIATQEGFFEPNTVAVRNNNPGNLIEAPWLSNQTGKAGFWIAASIQIGMAGAMHLIMLHIAEGNTLTQLIDAWAPPESGNNPTVYIQNVMTWTGIPDANVSLWNYLEPLADPRLQPKST